MVRGFNSKVLDTAYNKLSQLKIKYSRTFVCIVFIVNDQEEH